MAKTRWWRYLPILLAIAVAVYFRIELSTQTIAADEPVTWKCTTQVHLYPGPLVILRFARAPEYFSFWADNDGSLCRFFSQSGQSTVTMHSEVWGNRRSGMSGWHELTFNGRTPPPPPAMIIGGSGRDGDAEHPEPYAQDFDAALHRRQP